MTQRARQIIDAVLALDPLADLPRTGWLLRGVRPCESIAEHSFGVALVTMYLVDALRAAGEPVDGERALRMALVHDAPEARTGDVPMPVKTPALDAALSDAEAALAAQLLPAPQHTLWLELEAGTSVEARLVRCADKVHMLIKALVYTDRGSPRLAEFWSNAKTFDDRGISVVREVFAALCARAGRPLPGAGEPR